MARDADDDAGARPWYREPLVWMLIAIPASAVVMAAIMIPLAVSTHDGLVADDYYKRGLQINRVLARDEQARSLGLALERVRIADGGVTLRLSVPADTPLPARLDLALAHATRSEFDQSTTLMHQGEGLYAGEMGVLQPGAWHVVVGTPEWSLTDRYFVGS